jgi:metal-responsive CopG/Arc/MetJ family transcriptional regulator
MSTEVVRTTIALPQDLLGAIDRAIGDGKARSRNEFVATALQHELVALERAAIDASFAEMAFDSEYASEAEQIAREFARADWEALDPGEGES